ncbi:MAG: L-histidine N(alpha)-methyltransferase [Flavobacteriales bacterium]|nr:L-histidine N(alpha)-methyltransferase [Flavobacteriales bacterium]|tara:strand:+ start:7977 stop:8909 length:933 start_codon:yes stop_codon:yes gene_type:complete
MKDFEKEVKKGLSNKSKTLPTKYFYDAKGSELFQEIMDLEEYYLPACEREILKDSSNQLAANISSLCNEIEIIGLGAGDGTKTVELLKAFMPLFQDIDYYPLDISASILEENKENLQASIPGLSVKPVAGNYFKTLPKLPQSETKRLILFMGANIGNYSPEKAIEFVRFLKENSRTNDLLLIAFDLKKDPEKILAAYNDKEGVTAKFNMNLLARINNELNGKFDLNQFKHFPTYDPISGVCKSHLVSLEAQTVSIGDNTYSFKAFEAIQTEVSIKYDLSEIEKLATDTGIKLIKHFPDSKNYYTLALYQV